jgi:hypothetical protein
MIEFWLGFAFAYFLAGGLTLRLIRSSHRACHGDDPRAVGADLYTFFVWPAVLTILGAGE